MYFRSFPYLCAKNFAFPSPPPPPPKLAPDPRLHGLISDARSRLFFSPPPLWHSAVVFPQTLAPFYSDEKFLPLMHPQDGTPIFPRPESPVVLWTFWLTSSPVHRKIPLFPPLLVFWCSQHVFSFHPWPFFRFNVPDWILPRLLMMRRYSSRSFIQGPPFFFWRGTPPHGTAIFRFLSLTPFYRRSFFPPFSVILFLLFAATPSSPFIQTRETFFFSLKRHFPLGSPCLFFDLSPLFEMLQIWSPLITGSCFLFIGKGPLLPSLKNDFVQNLVNFFYCAQG